GRLAGERRLAGIEIKLRPARARNRPRLLVTLDESLAGMAQLELDRRLALPAGVLALEEMAEEALLQLDAVVRVETRPMLEPVHFEPLLFRGGAHEALEIAARMQPLTAPARRREEGGRHLLPRRRARAVIVVVEGVRANLGAEVRAVAHELLLGERLRPADELARHPAPGPARPHPMLHGLDLRVVPVRHEGREDAAVIAHVAIEVGSPLPGAHGGKVRGLQRGDLPLVDGV